MVPIIVTYNNSLPIQLQKKCQRRKMNVLKSTTFVKLRYFFRSGTMHVQSTTALFSEIHAFLAKSIEGIMTKKLLVFKILKKKYFYRRRCLNASLLHRINISKNYVSPCQNKQRVKTISDLLHLMPCSIIRSFTFSPEFRGFIEILSFEQRNTYLFFGRNTRINIDNYEIFHRRLR